MHTPRSPGKRAGRAASASSSVILLNKPYGVLCQFSADGSGKPTLAEFVQVPDVYPAGRLDADSEGLVVLTADGALQAQIAGRGRGYAKTYWVQVEGAPNAVQLEQLAEGVDLGDFVTAPCDARAIELPAQLWPRDPPIRVRRAIPTSWLALTLQEGRNRQVRRMTAAAGAPTLPDSLVGRTLDARRPCAGRNPSRGSSDPRVIIAAHSLNSARLVAHSRPGPADRLRPPARPARPWDPPRPSPSFAYPTALAANASRDLLTDQL